MDPSPQWAGRTSSQLHFRGVIKSRWGITVSSRASGLQCSNHSTAVTGVKKMTSPPAPQPPPWAWLQTVRRGCDNGSPPLSLSGASFWVKCRLISTLKRTFALRLIFTSYSPGPELTRPLTTCDNLQVTQGAPWFTQASLWQAFQTDPWQNHISLIYIICMARNIYSDKPQHKNKMDSF